jgi:hypothetical protein
LSEHGFEYMLICSSANNDVEFSDDEPDLNDESAVRLLPRFRHVC